jgi:myosin heavy subunit
MLDIHPTHSACEPLQTVSGLFCLTVNPWRWLPLYTEDIMHMYEGNAKNRPPHVYQIANTAYTSIINGGGDQSILITLADLSSI